MKLRVKYTAQLRTAVGRTEDAVELPEGSNLMALMRHLTDQLDGAAPHLVSTAGRLQPSLLIVVNDTAVAVRDAPSIVLKSGDTVLLLPAIAGG